MNERDRQMVDLHRLGLPYTEIGRRFGIGRQSAERAIKRATATKHELSGRALNCLKSIGLEHPTKADVRAIIPTIRGRGGRCLVRNMGAETLKELETWAQE